ncbi:MATE family efflux transporter [Mesoplasma seiffertii]|uniref:MATE family efflux transporter n=1 Tax=Mesoplasma seiffertii TaxID=28224 RepID=UPI00047AB735|nr:MATE family efflux transporter [Mesoplasma seiffertii]
MTTNIETNTQNNLNFIRKNRFYPNNWKEILALTGHIFLQLFFAAIIAQINVLLFSWYDERLYLASINRATLLFTTIQFIPSLIASGTLVVGGNLYGQGRQKELSKVITTGVVVNVIISLFVILLMQIFANSLLVFLGAGNESILGSTHQYDTNLQFTSLYFRIIVLNLFILSIAQVYIAGLQILKKQRHVAIGAIISNIVDVFVVCMVLYILKIDPVLAAFAMPIAGLVQMVYMIVINFKYIDYRGATFKTLINSKFAFETIKIGLPITLEIGLWNVCNFAMNGAIGHLSEDQQTIDNLLNLHRSINAIIQYSTTFLQAVATVTSILVAKKIGEGDLNGAFRAGVDCWKVAIYAQLILSLFIFSLIYPLLLAYNTPKNLIVNYGFYLYAIIFIKCLFDTVNMTLLRALWSVGDLWVPLMISIFTMIIGMVALPWIITLTFIGTPGVGLILIYLVISLDPISRSIIYAIRWFKRKWFKYAKTI